MFNWAKQQLANVAGTQEPIYGPSAIKSVAVDAEKTPYTELTRDDLKWQQMDSTSVETASFYFTSDNGDIALAQVIYSNVAGIHVTCQFNCKVFSKDAAKPHLWSPNPLHNVDFSQDKTGFYADDCAVELSEDGTSYTIKSMNDKNCVVNLKLTRTTPGWHAGTNGKSLFGTDVKNPWGSIYHRFWPRCTAEGTITAKDGAIDFKGKALYIRALQGMKPHHAACRWTFADFQGPTHSAIMMEFTTPPSYGSTRVNVSCVVKNGEIITAGCTGTVTNTATKKDDEVEWPEPTEITFAWNGSTKDGKPVEALIAGAVGPRTDRVDIMAEVPGFVKSIVAAAAGTKPYIYQFNTKKTLKIKVGDSEVSEEGQLFSEATFISGLE